MLLGYPLFPGDSGVDQLVEIIKVLGTPSKEQILAMNEHYSEFKFPFIKPSPWNVVFKSKVCQEAIDITGKILMYEPHKRITPLETLLHPFFDEIKEENCKLNNGHSLPAKLFDFTKEEINSDPDTVSKIIPEW